MFIWISLFLDVPLGSRQEMGLRGETLICMMLDHMCLRYNMFDLLRSCKQNVDFEP